jgi:hypothetical protein
MNPTVSLHMMMEGEPACEKVLTRNGAKENVEYMCQFNNTPSS